MTRKQKIGTGIATACLLLLASVWIWWKPISATMFDWFVADSLETQLQQTYQPVRQMGGE